MLIDVLLYGLATALFGIEAIRSKSLLAFGLTAFALVFLLHALGAA